MFKQAVLSIWIKDKGFVTQGKFCYIDSKPCFIANMTEHKWYRNYQGYAISRRILDSLPRGTKIIYKRLDLNSYYIAGITKFRSKGILLTDGSHSQWVLPLKNWVAKAGELEGEPKNLPVINIIDWKKEDLPVEQTEPVSANVWLENRLKLRDVLVSKGVL